MLHPASRADSLDDRAEQRLAGVLRVDTEPGSKRLQAVALVPSDGSEAVVLSYRAPAFWQSLNGRTALVYGRPEQPDPRAQAVVAPHFAWTRVELADRLDPDAAWVSVGRLEAVKGRVEVRAGDPGTKSEGSSWTVIAAERALRVANPDGLEVGAEVELLGHLLEPSPVRTGMGGPELWWVEKVGQKPEPGGRPGPKVPGQDRGAVAGTILDATTGAPVAGAVVTVTGPHLGFERRRVADAGGNFSEGSLPPGEVTLRVEHPGFATRQVEHVTLANDATATVEVRLTPRAPAPD